MHPARADERTKKLEPRPDVVDGGIGVQLGLLLPLAGPRAPAGTRPAGPDLTWEERLDRLPDDLVGMYYLG